LFTLKRNILKFLVMIKIFNNVTTFKIPNVVGRSHRAHCRRGENLCHDSMWVLTLLVLYVYLKLYIYVDDICSMYSPS